MKKMYLFLMGLLTGLIGALSTGPSTYAENNARCATPMSSSGFKDCVYSYSKEHIPVNYRMYGAPDGSQFDPSKPTIVYFQGGPEPVSQRDLNGFPPGMQVIIVDMVGVSASNKNFPHLSDEEVGRLFGSDQQASVVEQIIKREGISNYIFWGESNGVQLALRALDKVQRDKNITSKPKTAVLISGIVRKDTVADQQQMEKRCKQLTNVQPVKTTHQKPAPANASQWDANVQLYLENCGIAKSPHVEQLGGFIETELRPALRPNFTARDLQHLLGCPPFNALNYERWREAMVCGSFQDQALCLNNCRFGTDVKYCQSNCANRIQPQCHDQPLDVKNYAIGDTAIFNIVASDDCNVPNFDQRDYLANNTFKNPDSLPLQKAKLETLVMHSGGHVAFRGASYSNCNNSRTPTSDDHFRQILQDFFQADLSAAKTAIVNCENTTPAAASTKQPSNAAR